MSIVFKYFIYFIFIFIDIFIYFKIFFREHFFYIPKINKVGFIKSTINIDGSIHKIYQIGNNDASDNDTLLLIGGIPTDPMESMTWLANELHKLNDNFRIIILNMPFYENNF